MNGAISSTAQLAKRRPTRSRFPMRCCLPAALLIVLAAAWPASAHDFPHSFEARPKPPPTIDPGPDAARLRIRITDAKSGQPTAATVCVNNGDQEPDNDP